ncbi:MAG TPA: LysR family transcriptional regulator [Chloroflexi bacterium]|nr:LysR family transcriptional regulator [Chloroflexota bacterium]
MLGIYELTIFLAAAETENFSKAARRLNLSQPAVSMQIRTMEQELGITLFHRAGRTLALTEQGKALVPMARDLVKRSLQVEEEIEVLKGEVVGHLKIGCSTTTGKYYLPMLIARFRQRYPRVQVTIYNDSQTKISASLCDGEIHLSVMSARPFCADAKYHHFFDDYVVLVVGPDHLWAERDSIAPKELSGANFILRDTQSGTREEVNRALNKVGITLDDLNLAMEIGNTEAISMAVEEGIGAAFISRVVARRGIELGRLKEVRVTGLSLHRKIFIAYSRRHPSTRAQTAFWDFALEPENQTLLKTVV